MKLSTTQWVLIGVGGLLAFNYFRVKNKLTKWVKSPEIKELGKDIETSEKELMPVGMTLEGNNKNVWNEAIQKGIAFNESFRKSGKSKEEVMKTMTAEQYCFSTIGGMKQGGMKIPTNMPFDKWLSSCMTEYKAFKKAGMFGFGGREIFDGEFETFMD